MGKIHKGHPRFGAKVGDVVDGFVCTSRSGAVVIDNRRTPWNFDSIEEARRWARVWDRTTPADAPHRAVFAVTRWRRVRPKLKWAGAFLMPPTECDGDTFCFATGQFVRLYKHPKGTVTLEYPPHVITNEQRKRFCERVAWLYGYEVEARKL